ncbi:MAG: XRE family transcriptional regulator, partial [Puniceicoccaceae bacterium]
MDETTQLLFVSADLSKQLPERVTNLRKAAGLTQAQVAERLGITEGRYGHYERGFRRFPVSIIPKLAEALECSETDLLGISRPASKRGPLSGWERR